MSKGTLLEDTRTAGAAVGEAVGIFMLHPETLAESVEAGYANPFAGYVAGRGGVLGETNAVTVNAVFVVFEPEFVRTCWEAGVAVRGAAGAAALYWDQVAGFAGRHLAGAEANVEQTQPRGFIPRGVQLHPQGPNGSGLRLSPGAIGVSLRQVRDHHQALLVVKPLQQHIHVAAEDLVLEPLIEEDVSLATILKPRIDGLAEPLRDRAHLVPMRTREGERDLEAKLRLVGRNGHAEKIGRRRQNLQPAVIGTRIVAETVGWPPPAVLPFAFHRRTTNSQRPPLTSCSASCCSYSCCRWPCRRLRPV